MELKEIIANRRTVKPDRYTGEKVDDALIWEMLRSANWAPTHGFTEPWRFVVFDENSKHQLLEFLNKLDAKLNGENEVRNEKRAKMIEAASHIIAIGMKRGENPKIPELEELLSVGMAVQNMWLTAYNLGFGGYWSTGGLAFTDELRDYIGLKEGDKSLGFFYVGQPIEGLPKGRRVTEIEEKVEWR